MPTIATSAFSATRRVRTPARSHANDRDQRVQRHQKPLRKRTKREMVGGCVPCPLAGRAVENPTA
eukprot:16355995-Heterocapsa_arctica.AAC.1